MRRKTIKIEMGSSLATREPVYFMARYYGSVGIISAQRYGKSVIAKILALGFNKQKRRIIIIDVRGEWRKSITKRNQYSEYPESLFNLKVIRKPRLRISDLKIVEEWIHLGFSDKSVEIITKLANKVDLHEDDIEKFGEILEEFPSTKERLSGWNEKYPDLELKSPIFPATSQAINNNWFNIKRNFYNPKNPQDTTWVSNWRKQAMNSNLLIDLEFTTNEVFAGAIVGHVLKELVPILINLQPVIIVEEADYLFGNPEYHVPYMYSTKMGIAYVLKYAKYSSFMMFITQKTDLLHPAISEVLSTFILGRLSKQDPKYDEVRGTRPVLSKGYRPMCYIDEDDSIKIRFQPMMPPCMY